MVIVLLLYFIFHSSSIVTKMGDTLSANMSQDGTDNGYCIELCYEECHCDSHVNHTNIAGTISIVW